MAVTIELHTRARGRTKAVLLCFLAVAALLCATPLSRAALLPGADMALGQKKQAAITQLQNGQFELAYDAFMDLLRELPEDDDVNMGIALSSYRLKNYTQSLLAYERLIAKYPQTAGFRLQIARVYIALGEPQSARLELQKAKEYDRDLTDESIEEIVTALSATPSRWQHFGRLSAGVIYDTNSNQGTRSNLLSLGAFTDLYVDGAKEKASWGNYLSTTYELGYRLGDESPWWIMGDVMGYQRWNTASGVRANKSFSYGRAAFGLRYLGESLLVDLRLKGDAANQHHRGSEDQDITSFGPELSFIVAPHRRFQLITRGTVEERKYTVSNMRDGAYWTASQFLRVFIGEKNHEILAGATFTGNDPDVRAYRYLGVEPTLRLVVKLPYDVTVSPFISFREENYEAPATGLETTDRRDKQWRAGAAVIWDITDSLSLDATYQYVDNISNSALYRYDQHFGSLGLTWKF